MNDSVFYATILALFFITVGHPYIALLIFLLGVL